MKMNIPTKYHGDIRSAITVKITTAITIPCSQTIDFDHKVRNQLGTWASYLSVSKLNTSTFFVFLAVALNRRSSYRLRNSLSCRN
jgi:hypothetical protein